MRADDRRLNDTIVAVATFPAASAVGIVKLSGSDAVGIVKGIFEPKKPKDLMCVSTYTLHYGWIKDKKELLDEVLVAVMRAPHSHTAEDVVEIHAHAGAYVLDRIVRLCCARGARVAEPGEFTLRAFLNGRIDLVQAEGTLDIISAAGEEALRLGVAQASGRLSAAIGELEDLLERAHARLEAAMSFPEDAPVDVLPVAQDLAAAAVRLKRLLAHTEKARVYRDGLRCVICGMPNAGKSSLLNMLLEEERVIVSSVAGTTRDVVEERLTVRGVPLVLADTAGILDPRDEIEEQAIARSLARIEDADVVLYVLDASRPLSAADKDLLARVRGKNAIVVLNKADLKRRVKTDAAALRGLRTVAVAAKTHEGLAALEEAIVAASKAGALPKGQDLFVSNKRHIALLSQAQEHLAAAESLLAAASDRALFHTRDARDAVRAVLGRSHDDDILESVFSRFCIGK